MRGLARYRDNTHLRLLKCSNISKQLLDVLLSDAGLEVGDGDHGPLERRDAHNVLSPDHISPGLRLRLPLPLSSSEGVSLHRRPRVVVVKAPTSHWRSVPCRPRPGATQVYSFPESEELLVKPLRPAATSAPPHVLFFRPRGSSQHGGCGRSSAPGRGRPQSWLLLRGG